MSKDMTPGQLALYQKHGTPDQFESACWNVYDDGTITAQEVMEAANKYRTEFNMAGIGPTVEQEKQVKEAVTP